MLIDPEHGGLSVERRLIVRFSEERLDRNQDCANVISGRPLVLQDVEADVAEDVNVGVEAGRVELDLGGLERIISGKREGEPVDHPLVHCVLAPTDRPFPAEYVVSLRECRYARIAAHLTTYIRIKTYQLLKVL